MQQAEQDPSNMVHQQGKVMNQVESPSRKSSQDQKRQGQSQDWRQDSKVRAGDKIRDRTESKHT